MLLVFDLDGTLYKTHKTCLAVLKELCEEFGLQISAEDEKYLMYTTVAALLEKIAPQMPEEERHRFEQEFKWREIELVSQIGELFEGAEEMLEALKAKGHKLAICGMGSAEYINTVLTHCNIKRLIDIVYPRQHGKTKSQVLSQLINVSGERKENCIMIGDSVTDLTAAKDNLLPFIGVSYGYGAKDLDGYVISDNITELEGRINQFSVFSSIYKAATRCAKPLIIGVNGVDTSGKTIFSERLKCFLESLGHDTLLIHIDDFHIKRERRMKDPSPQGYIENTFDTEKLSDLISEIKRGPVDLTLELLDLETDDYTNIKRFKTGFNTVVIAEGVLLYRPPLDEHFGYKVFLDIDFDEVVRRAKKRDVPKYGEEFLERYINRYIPAQKIYLEEFSPKENADIVIGNSDFNNPVIRVLK